MTRFLNSFTPKISIVLIAGVGFVRFDECPLQYAGVAVVFAGLGECPPNRASLDSRPCIRKLMQGWRSPVNRARLKILRPSVFRGSNPLPCILFSVLRLRKQTESLIAVRRHLVPQHSKFDETENKGVQQGQACTSLYAPVIRTCRRSARSSWPWPWILWRSPSRPARWCGPLSRARACLSGR